MPDFSSLVDARKDASIQLAFCWAHLRRPFYEIYHFYPITARG